MKQSQPIFDHLGLRLARAFRTFKAHMLEYLHSLGYTDLTPTHMLILPVINQEGTSVADIIRITDLTKQSVSRAIGELEDLGYIRLGHLEGNRRSKLAWLTDRSLQMAQDSKAGKEAFEARVSKRLGKKNLRFLMEGLEAITESLEEKN